MAMCPGRDQEQVRLVEAPAKRLHHVSFTLRPGSMDAVREALERGGAPVIEPPAGGTEDGLWLRDPDGTAVQLLDEPQAQGPAAEVLVNMGGTRQRFDIAQWTGHRGRAAPAARALAAVHRPAPADDGLLHPGARFAGQRHDPPRPGDLPQRGPGDHHVFGFISSTHRGFHHASFEVPSIDAIAVGADRMRCGGGEAGWGLGRRRRINFFRYNPDPWGSWIEWFSDIDQIDDCWVASDWDVPPHLWGAPPPETFLANQEPASSRKYVLIIPHEGVHYGP